MRVSDLDPQQREIYEAGLAETFERVDDINEGLAERAAQRRADGTDLEERYEARQREERDREAAAAPKSVPAIPRAPARDWQAEEKWVSRIILKETQPAFGEVGKMLARTDHQLDRLEDRVTKSEVAVTELLMELERRVVALERDAIRKPPKPRLIASGGSDAA